jgi:hypothetical protein
VLVKTLYNKGDAITGLTTIGSIDRCERDEDSSVLRCLLDAINTQSSVEQNSCRVFSTVDEMGKDVSGVIITSNALKSAPNSR